MDISNEIKVSVLMCAFNAEKYNKDSIESVLNQTYKNFEFIIVDDGSTDHTQSIIRSYDDRRISLVACKHDYIKSLNVGLSKCKGNYIARLDADDLMLPDRLEKQLSIMEKETAISVCFSWGTTFGDSEGLIGHNVNELIEHPSFWLITGNLFMHSSAMIRRCFINTYHLRYKRYDYAEDYKLWVDIAFRGGKFYVIPEPLFRYRISETQVSTRFHNEQNDTRLVIQQEVLEQLLKTINHVAKQNLMRTYRQLLKLNTLGLISGDEVIVIMFRLIKRTRWFI